MARVATNADKGVADAQLGSFGKDALGLFDQDPALEGSPELVANEAGLLEGSLLQDGNRGGVCDRLGGANVELIEATGGGSKKIESADDLVAEPYRQGVDGAVPPTHRERREVGPLAVYMGQVWVDHRLTASIAVKTRPFLRLNLEQLDHSELFSRRCQHSEGPVRIGQQKACGGVKQLDAALHKHLGDLDHVKVVDKGIGQLDERPHQ